MEHIGSIDGEMTRQSTSINSAKNWSCKCKLYLFIPYYRLF